MRVAQHRIFRGTSRAFVCLCAALSTLTFPVISAVQKPTRTECIIGFNLDWSDVRANRSDVRNALDRPFGQNRIEALAAMFISRDGLRLYLQFAHNCHEKQQMANALIAFWRSQGLDLPRFVRIEDPIVPSPSTIDVRGPAWIE
jgi:hypothetical protein